MDFLVLTRIQLGRSILSFPVDLVTLKPKNQLLAALLDTEELTALVCLPCFFGISARDLSEAVPRWVI